MKKKYKGYRDFQVTSGTDTVTAVRSFQRSLALVTKVDPEEVRKRLLGWDKDVPLGLIAKEFLEAIPVIWTRETWDAALDTEFFQKSGIPKGYAVIGCLVHRRDEALTEVPLVTWIIMEIGRMCEDPVPFLVSTILEDPLDELGQDLARCWSYAKKNCLQI